MNLIVNGYRLIYNIIHHINHWSEKNKYFPPWSIQLW